MLEASCIVSIRIPCLPIVIVVLIVESIRSLSPLPRGRRHVGRTSLNLCVDCFSLLVVVPVALVVSPAASSLARRADSSRVVVLFL